ncbi:AraC family transcriptional regulator [Streptomyces griseocarneus]|uniref:AraC family transcriptional regulator n=1 Tax=Streptomyces griseocarneus TaxID=51201 RepID=UPI00167E00A9|nr:AraC family transcriptional regulator [Streptomyces griseocarneus]MBZ6475935.1 AraC family transcriptional regulator [Streptomyces griseocarneus]
MDVLSDTMAALRTGRPRSALTERDGPWRVDLAAFAGIGFHVVLRGSCRLRVHGEDTVLVAGDAVLLPHGTAHTLADDAGAPAALLCGGYEIDRARAHPLLGDFPEVIRLAAHPGRYASLHAVVTLLGEELRAPGRGADATLPALLELLLVHLLRAWYEERAARPDAVTGWCLALADPSVGAALRALHDDPSKPWTVASLADRAGLSRAAFARRFGALAGRPPLTYLTWWRLTLAARLLRESDIPLAAVAQRIGYTSQFAFAHAFKRAYGVPAGRYRQDHRPENPGRPAAGQWHAVLRERSPDSLQLRP